MAGPDLYRARGLGLVQCHIPHYHHRNPDVDPCPRRHDGFDGFFYRGLDAHRGRIHLL